MFLQTPNCNEHGLNVSSFFVIGSMHGHPSSTDPSQSSSNPLHSSSSGSTMPVQLPNIPLMHFCTPFSHIPTMLEPHSLSSFSMQPQPSFIDPSQSLSTSSWHISSIATMLPMHSVNFNALSISLEQYCSPSPQLFNPHDLEKLSLYVMPQLVHSSMLPSQSLSLISAFSGLGTL